MHRICKFGFNSRTQFIRYHVNKLTGYDHGCTHGLPERERLQHHSNGGGVIESDDVDVVQRVLYRLLSSSDRSSLALVCSSLHSTRSWSRACRNAFNSVFISSRLTDGILDISRVFASISRSTDSNWHDARSMSYQIITERTTTLKQHMCSLTGAQMTATNCHHHYVNTSEYKTLWYIIAVSYTHLTLPTIYSV